MFVRAFIKPQAINNKPTTHAHTTNNNRNNDIRMGFIDNRKTTIHITITETKYDWITMTTNRNLYTWHFLVPPCPDCEKLQKLFSYCLHCKMSFICGLYVNDNLAVLHLSPGLHIIT